MAECGISEAVDAAAASARQTEGEAFLASSAIENALLIDDGQAAKRHLAAGRAIYYGDECYPEGIVKEYPDGRRELVAISNKGELTVIREI